MAVNPTRGAKKEPPKKKTPKEEYLYNKMNDALIGKPKKKKKKNGAKY